MKQFAHNACGTIALFHVIINALSTYPDIVVPDSYINKFKLDLLMRDWSNNNISESSLRVKDKSFFDVDMTMQNISGSRHGVYAFSRKDWDKIKEKVEDEERGVI